MAPLLFHERLTEAWFCLRAIAASSFLSTTNPAPSRSNGAPVMVWPVALACGTMPIVHRIALPLGDFGRIASGRCL